MSKYDVKFVTDLSDYKMGINLKKLEELFNSEEGKRKTEEYFQKLANQDAILDSQLERFRKRVLNDEGYFKLVVDKIKKKYFSDEYYERWSSRGIVAPEKLNWFLFRYAEKYGRECTDSEYNEYAGAFTTVMYYVHGYIFRRSDGQGSIIQIFYDKQLNE